MAWPKLICKKFKFKGLINVTSKGDIIKLQLELRTVFLSRESIGRGGSGFYLYRCPVSARGTAALIDKRRQSSRFFGF